ncbi:MAG: glycerol-3-phosphate 1-O-acyltransferase PlsY [Thiothrix sp.]|nr:glycerol-3-phosphate 1-O-acyltransferase PlsY [Thiothrix sp.]
MPYILILVAYLLGSISSAMITCRAMGLPDPRTTGSHNPGATNVLRIGGKKPAIITLLGDMLKGLLPVLLGKLWGLGDFWLFLIGFAALIGHMYPVFYQFKGGKGVATAIGVYLGIHFWAGVLVCLTWLFVAKGLKISSLSALIATLLAPLYFHLLTHDLSLSLGLLVMTALIWWRHRSNIRRMLDGSESIIKTDSRS